MLKYSKFPGFDLGYSSWISCQICVLPELLEFLLLNKMLQTYSTYSVNQRDKIWTKYRLRIVSSKRVKIEIQLFMGWKAHTIIIIILPLVFHFGISLEQILRNIERIWLHHINVWYWFRAFHYIFTRYSSFTQLNIWRRNLTITAWLSLHNSLLI